MNIQQLRLLAVDKKHRMMQSINYNESYTTFTDYLLIYSFLALFYCNQPFHSVLLLSATLSLLVLFVFHHLTILFSFRLHFSVMFRAALTIFFVLNPIASVFSMYPNSSHPIPCTFHYYYYSYFLQQC